MYFWRGDESKPPADWTDEFARETSYGKMSSKHGPKNQAGLFFFHDNRRMSEGYCETLRDHSRRTVFWLSTTKSTEPLNIIDFSQAGSIFEALRILRDLGIDVISRSFMTYDELGGDNVESVRNFAEIGEAYEEASRLIATGGKTTTHTTTIENIQRRIAFRNAARHTPVSIFGQRLTDFQNGPALVNLVQHCGHRIDGYRWREHNDNRGLTYCLFSHIKLTPPESMELVLSADSSLSQYI
jgi:hypothetical protein